MKCPKCGTEIPNDSIFCPECGVKLESNDNLPFYSQPWVKWATIIFAALLTFFLTAILV